MNFRFLIAAILAGVCLASEGVARDILVPQEFGSLSQALKLAGRDDRILISPGHYTGINLDLVDGLTIEGDVDDPGSVVIDAQAQGRVFRAESVAFVRIAGVTITGGAALGETNYSGSGGGLFVSASTVELDRVVFADNVANASGGALRIGHGEVEAHGCTFIDNRAVKGGGAVDLSYESDGTFHGATFRENVASWGGAIAVRTGSSTWCHESTFVGNTAVAPHEMGGAYFADYAATVLFQQCVFTANAARQGGAVRVADAGSLFLNCTLDGNAAWEHGGGVMIRGGYVRLDHTIVSYNQGTAVTSEEGVIDADASNIFGNLDGDWTGDLLRQRDSDDNLATDPMYCESGIYALQESSPCAAGNNPAGLIGALPAGCENVSVVLQDFDGDMHGSEVHLTWQVGAGDDLEFRLRGRRQGAAGSDAWDVPYLPDETPGSYRAVDKPSPEFGPIEYQLDARVGDGDWFFLGEILMNPATSIPTQPLSVSKVYPNPFNPRVNIIFRLAERSHVQAVVFDLRGRRVRTLVDATLHPGEHRLDWDSRDERGREMSTGTYLLRITDGHNQHSAKLQLVK